MSFHEKPSHYMNRRHMMKTYINTQYDRASHKMPISFRHNGCTRSSAMNRLTLHKMATTSFVQTIYTNKWAVIQNNIYLFTQGPICVI